MNLENIVVIVIFVLVAYCLLYYTNDEKEGFYLLNNNSNRLDKLYTDGNLFYLFLSNDGNLKKKNPLIFKTLEDAENYMDKNNYPKMKVNNINIKKLDDDPTETYEKECNKKFAEPNYKSNNWYGFYKDDKIKTYCKDIKESKDKYYDLQIENCKKEKVESDFLKESMFYF